MEEILPIDDVHSVPAKRDPPTAGPADGGSPAYLGVPTNGPPPADGSAAANGTASTDGDRPPTLTRSDEARLPTRYGNFRILAFTEAETGKDHLAIVSGDVTGAHGVLVRMHSECLTGDVLGSMRCDCGPQLDLALRRIAEEGGIVLYLRQEGRGIGLANKVRAYHLQDQGMDTVDANEQLGFPADARCYTVAAKMLDALDVACVRLMTNNPAKVEALKRKGIEVVGREPHEIPPTEENRLYLKTKQDRMRHIFSGVSEA